MRPLAEALPDLLPILQAFHLHRCAEPGPVRRELDRLAQHLRGGGAPPPLAELAALLDHLHLGFASLERAERYRETKPWIDLPPPGAPATLVVERLDLALRGLRLERGLTQPEVAVPAGIAPGELSTFESVHHRLKPPLAVLDRILRALEATYDDLESMAAHPLRRARRIGTRLRAAERRRAPVFLNGRVLPALVSERLDLALRSLRLQAGRSRKALARASGLPVKRIQAFESPLRGDRPSEDELAVLLDALAVDGELLERAARQPLQGTLELAPYRKPWRRRPVRPNRSPTENPTPRRSPLLQAATRVERGATGLRDSSSWAKAAESRSRPTDRPRCDRRRTTRGGT